MAHNEAIQVICYQTEIGMLCWDENKSQSRFQYNPDFLKSGQFLNLIPKTRIIKPIPQVQIFNRYNSETFRGLPPQFADSLPDMFGNIIFKSWLENNNKDFGKISVIEQLAYVSDRGMGAIEYKPKKDIPQSSTINIEEIVEVLKSVLELKGKASAKELNHQSLLNIFKMGTSAGGARPKILISENKSNGEIIPGDINYSKDYNHYLVKLNVEDDLPYNKELIEYSYYLAARYCGVTMMDSKMIEGKHFATTRFDRAEGEKVHVLTATGIAGWDFKDPSVSSYENLFELSLFLKLPHAQIEQLFRRMVFNIVFANQDDHLKNHSFIYDKQNDTWNLSPAYDVTYSLNPLINYKKTSRALSVNNKRAAITSEDIKYIAQKYTIKDYSSILYDIQKGISFWENTANQLKIPTHIINRILKDFTLLQQ